jgi:CDGSH-type Zn-finger protein/ferredoxin
MTTEQPSPRQRIEVMPHGPYEVSGDVPLRPKTIVSSDEGEAMTWSTGDEMSHPRTYQLCRCGQSDNKPFCDGSHGFELFDGTESAPTNTSAERVELHDGPAIRVLKDGDLCQHAGFCNTKARSWFDMIPETDDHQVRLQLLGMIEHCPSGALSYELDGERIEPDLPVAVSPVTDGPLFVSGGIEIERTSGELLETRNRVTLCRCGQSRNKPLCDGTHFEVDFKA